MPRNLEYFLSVSINAIKNITAEVIRECARRDLKIDENVASLAVSLLSLDPENGISLSSSFDRSTLENFVRKCAKNFLAYDLRTKCLEMQTYFMVNQIDFEKIERKYAENLNTKASALIKDILDCEPTNKEEQDRLFKKMALDATVQNMLGNPANQKVLDEAINSLKSVISRADLVNFIALKRKQRLESLENIRQVVCGIRVFNKDAGHCGEGIRDIVADIASAYKNTKSALNVTVEEISKRVEIFVKILDDLYKIDLKRDEIILILPDDVTENDFEILNQLLIINYQHQQYIRCLGKNLSHLKKDIDRQLESFKAVLKQIHEVVQYKTAVPTEKVFPNFTRLGIIWKCLLNILYTMVEINQINDNLMKLSDGTFLTHQQLIARLAKDPTTVTESPTGSGLSAISALKREIQSSECKIVSPSHDLMARPRLRFCAYTLAIGQGILRPADPNLGLLVIGSEFYSFKSTEYAKKFASNHQKYSAKFIKTIRKYPELIVFLDVFNEVKNFNFTVRKRPEPMAKPRLMVDMDVQTELHPIPYHKDKNYTWNIWDLRRKAIQLADMKNCRTNSAQTDISHYRYNKNIQTCKVKDDTSQTVKEGYTNIADKTQNQARAQANSGFLDELTIKDIFTASFVLRAKKLQ